MSLSVTHYVCFFVAFWIIRFCVRSALALHFHFQFGRIGFFSIRDIRYHHHKSSETALWSLQVGKLKLRLSKRPTISSPIAYITIHIGNVRFKVHSLKAILSQHKKTAGAFTNKRLSRVSSTLQKPWWYSLSIVKYLIKFTSALPAQMLMTGLANYVDLQIENFELDIEDQCVQIKVKKINFSSVLYADITNNSQATYTSTDAHQSIPLSPSSPNHLDRLHNDTDADMDFSSRYTYQRHSLKRAQHLFREKLFEVIINIDTVSVMGVDNLSEKCTNEQIDMLTLPSGGHIAVSCHLSAGCVTLKDVDINSRIFAVRLKSNPLIRLAQDLRCMLDATKRNHLSNQQPKSSSTITKIFRSITTSIDNTLIETQHQQLCSSLLTIQDVYLSGIIKGQDVLLEPYYKLQCLLGTITWTMTDGSLPEADCRMRWFRIKEIKTTTKLMYSTKYDSRLDAIPSEHAEVSSQFEDLRPNKKYIHMNLSVIEPSIFVDLSKIAMLQKVKMKANDTTNSPKEEPSAQSKKSSLSFRNLPRINVSLVVEEPSIQISNPSTNNIALISTENVCVDLDGSYGVQNPYTSIKTSPSGKLPTQENNAHSLQPVVTLKRVNTKSRPNWINLFRRNRKAKSVNNVAESASYEWHYKLSLSYAIQQTKLDITTKAGDCALSDQPNSSSTKYLLSVQNFKTSLYTCLDVTFNEDALQQHTNVLWCPDTQHTSAIITIDNPVVNLWANKLKTGESQLDFWLELFSRRLKSSSSEQVVQRPSVKKNRKNSGFFTMLDADVNVNAFTVLVGGTDIGVKGKRKVPAGYLDNAPLADINSVLSIRIERTQLSFNGSNLYNTSNDDHIKDSAPDATIPPSYTPKHSNSQSDMTAKLLSAMHLSLQHLVMEKAFGSDVNNTMQANQQQMTNDRMILWVSKITTDIETSMNGNTNSMSISPSIKIQKMGLNYSITNHYACLVTINSTVKNLKRTLSTRGTKSNTAQSSKRIVLQQVRIVIEQIDLHVFLPHKTQLYLRMNALQSTWNKKSHANSGFPAINIHNLTAFGVSPDQLDKWEQLIDVSKIHFSLEKDIDFATGKLFRAHQLDLSKLYLRIPYNYHINKLLDNTVTLIKAIKCLHARVSKDVPFLYFGPHEKIAPVVVPHLRLICRIITVQFDDDPFEAKLRLIYRAGIIEQSNREAIDKAFQQKAKTIIEESKSKNDTDEAKEHADSRVNEAYQGLLEHKSRLWKKRIDALIAKECNFYEELQSVDDSSPSQCDIEPHYLAKMFEIDPVSLPLYPPLANFTVKCSSFDFGPPAFELNQTRQFIHDVGKGQPVDKPLSTLTPFHLNWKAGETWVQIRDYPVPFILVPPMPDNDESPNCFKISAQKTVAPSWSLSGDYVFADDLGDIDATRRIELQIIDEELIEYSIDVTRTSTAMKTFSIVDIQVHNPALSHICWSVSYQPAIQDFTRVLDTITKPPVDPSEKIGFWDKIRLVLHTRVKISFVGGGDLAIVMKGTRDPYDMSEKGFGLAKVWRNDVVWLMGYKNPQKEFMQIISHDYAFGVPDLLHGGYTAPYVTVALYKDNSSNVTEPQPMRLSTSGSSFNSNVVDVKGNSRFVKIALKLSGGIRMGFGCQLERKCNPGCELCNEDNKIEPDAREAHKRKLLQFLPHYKVKFKTPQNVHEVNYDAYRGFRSDYIHFSISIIKTSAYEAETDKNTVIGNSMHLTPAFIDYYVSWFRLFGGAMSYPLRSGSLFPREDKRHAKKFGRHMSTMKYKVAVDPLTIGYFIKDEIINPEEMKLEELGDMIGLKGFVRHFSIDIHQRREIVNVADYKLDQKRLKANWPMTEAEVQLRDVDLRVVKACYNLSDDESLQFTAAENISVPINMDVYAMGEEDCNLNMLEGLNYKCANDSDATYWIDFDDFVELGYNNPVTAPVIQNLPFVFTPCIYYLRQTNRDDIQKYKYLHDTHDCILGTAIGTRELQMSLLRERCNSIDIQIRKHQARLHTIEVKRMQHGSNEKSLEELSDSIVEKTRVLYEKRELIQKYLKELSTQEILDVAHTKKPYQESTIFGKDPLTKWEDIMGYFKVRYIAHNPQIIWNNTLRNILYHAMDLRDHRRALSYYMTSRTIKFLRDLIDNADPQYTHRASQVCFGEDDEGMDSSMAQDLIEKLLSEQETHFYAENETEGSHPIQSNGLNEIDMSQTENVNDPVMQLKSVPSDYVMKSSYLIDLLNPQISLQSDCDPDNIVLVANERTQVKGLNIVDENDLDVEMELVKHRTVVSLDNVQFFVAKKEHFDSVDLLLDNHYGARESDHWLAWVPPELLISYVKTSDKFQRIGDRIAATLQYDKYNPLRIKSTTSHKFNQIHPFAERCDTVQLNFPSLQLSANSSQYNAVYQVATDLLLYKEPAKKERLARLRDIMLSTDQSNILETAEKVADLQSRIRHLSNLREQNRRKPGPLDEKRIAEMRAVRTSLYDACEDLYLIMEAIKLLQSNQKKDYHEPKANLKFIFCAKNMEWKMFTKDEEPFCESSLTNFTFNFMSKEDHSSTNILEVDVIKVRNVSPSPVFVDVLSAYYDPRKYHDFSRHKMLRCYFVSMAPVGGIPVIQHLEINLHPLRVQMTYNFGKQLAYYFFPPEKPQKQITNTSTVNSSSASTSASNSAAIPELDMVAENTLSTNPAEMIPQPSLSDRSDTNSLKLNNGNNSSAPPSLNITTPESQRIPYNSAMITSNAILPKDNTIQALPTESLNSSASLPTGLSPRKQRKHTSSKLSRVRTSDDLTVMKKRASSNRTFILVKIPGTKHCLSYQGPKEKNFEDLRDFTFEQPTLEFRNETWSWFELAANIKKDFMKAALLHNSKALLKEKLLRRHPRENTRLIESSDSVHSMPIYITNHSAEPVRDNKNLFDDALSNSESSREDNDDSDFRDTSSLHSAISQETYDAEETKQQQPPKKSLLWRKLKHKKNGQKSSKSAEASSLEPPNHVGGSSKSNASTVESSGTELTYVQSRSVSAATRHLNDSDQLAIKGKYLLGKNYNGPTQWLGPSF